MKKLKNHSSYPCCGLPTLDKKLYRMLFSNFANVDITFELAIRLRILILHALHR